ncbi:MAG: type IV pilus modification protein PilV [Neisseriaceae bacterium]|nr:MAG: type IV pilus modification protein PilV [Neisseriaceae bacterium]
MKSHQLNHQYRKQSGIMLIEVVVSIFILGLGILALLGMQMRSLGSIKQAQNIAQVSQAVDNLAQGLTVNPYLRLKLIPYKGYITEKNYDHYKNFNNCNNRGSSPFINLDSSLNHQQLANQQLNQFCQEIKQIEGISPNDIQLKVCTNSSIQGNLPWNFSCNRGGTETVIKVVWKYRTKTESQNNLDNSGVIDKDNKIILSYEVPLTE